MKHMKNISGPFVRVSASSDIFMAKYAVNIMYRHNISALAKFTNFNCNYQ